MYIVTASAGDELSGCLVGFATQCSLRPTRYLVCLSILNHTYGVADRSSVLGVHLLTHEHRGLASLFGEQTGDMVDKFGVISWHVGAAGAPILDDCTIHFEGSIVDKVTLGDHVGFVLEPVGSIHEPRQLPDALLTLHDVESFRAGHPVD